MNNTADLLGAGPLALFLDVDGTLAPIAPHPSEVRIDPRLVPVLARLHVKLEGALAVVSGRPLEQVDALLEPLKLPAAGVHGAQRRDARGQVHVHERVLPEAVAASMNELAERHAGIWIERKPCALALHYRAAPHLEARCRAAVERAVADHQEWTYIAGKCVFEVRPRGVSKAGAVEAFLGEAPFAGRHAIFVGDDVTDEDGFAAVQSTGGLGVKVGAGPTCAQARLDDPASVSAWLIVLDTELGDSGSAAAASASIPPTTTRGLHA